VSADVKVRFARYPGVSEIESHKPTLSIAGARALVAAATSALWLGHGSAY
jgi:hypothetical protein